MIVFKIDGSSETVKLPETIEDAHALEMAAPVKKDAAVCVLTAHGLNDILLAGGSQAWALDARRAKKREYVVCVQNRMAMTGSAHPTAPHHTAFLVGRLKDVVLKTKNQNATKRWMLAFSEYAEIEIPDAWPGYRNPVLYTDLESLGIDIEKLEFHPMPQRELSQEQELDEDQNEKSEPNNRPLTIAEAKAGLALTFGVDPSNIEIIVRA